MKELKNKVQEILETNLASRENDNIVITFLWTENVNKQNIFLVSSFFDALNSNRMYSPESICRYIRLVKKQNPHLRGSRPRRKEREVIQDLKQA